MRSKKLNNLTIILINKRYTYVLKRGYIIITMILSLVSMKSQAQYDVSFSHYFDMEPSFNAAAVGKSPKLNIAAAYAMQMAGFKRNPNTMYAGAIPIPFSMILAAISGLVIYLINSIAAAVCASSK